MRYLMAALAVATCPCHLPLLLVLLGSTAFGAALSEHTAVVLVALTVLVVLSAWAALRMFAQPDPAGGEARPARTSKVGGRPRSRAGERDEARAAMAMPHQTNPGLQKAVLEGGQSS